MMKDVTERFIEYAKIPTMSSEQSAGCPSTEKQRRLAEIIVRELEALGLEVTLTENCYIYAKLEANSEAAATVGFIAHIDTSPDAPDENVKPRRVLYSGDDILLNEEKGIYLSEKDSPALALYRGKELIVTDGTTLLGADDKAGVCEIGARNNNRKGSSSRRGKDSFYSRRGDRPRRGFVRRGVFRR